jgi:hypothetical protein
MAYCHQVDVRHWTLNKIDRNLIFCLFSLFYQQKNPDYGACFVNPAERCVSYLFTVGVRA